MPTIKPIELEAASEASANILKLMEDKVKRPVNMLRMFAHSPAMLDAYVHFLGALDQCQTTPLVRTLLIATVAQEMGGEYMLSGVAAFGPREGASPAQIEDSRRAKSENPKTQLVLQFAAKAVQQLGHVPHSDVAALRQAGVFDAEIVELISIVGLNIWRNLFNMILETPNDFPLVKVDQPLPGAGHV